MSAGFLGVTAEFETSEVMSSTPSRSRGGADAIRVGLPRRPMQDLYFELMRGSWTGLVVLFVALYLLVNVAFGLMFWIDERALTDGHAKFSDSFFFSVQTLSTIGYGSMSPASEFADIVVTVESMVGLLGVAVGTGIVFTKFSRSRAGVMFSETVVVNMRNGKPCLMLRVANARGNEVVEAAIRVAVLLPEDTTEGISMRRVLDLPLVRSTSPIFSLSWQVMHEIDEASPLYGYDVERLGQERALFIVTLTGIDDTFSEAVHARYIYTDLELRVGARFVDVIDYVDERLRIDLRRFHETRADEHWPSGHVRFDAPSA